MKQSREKQAAEAYLKFLGQKGASAGTLYRRSLFLDSLTAGLAGKTQNATEFGKVLTDVLKTVTQLDMLECQNTAREFYPFWMNDIKAIALFEKHYGYDVKPVKWKPLPASLEKLTESLEHESFDERDTLALLRYSRHLYVQGAEPLVVDTRLKLAKVVVVRLRDAPVKSNITYRMAVDMTLPLFRVKEIRELFLAVVREFYYFWTETHDKTKRAA
ncbi:MAG TPA: hypothetical protein PLR90_07405 [Methylophilus sp.]|nr:hypothetical protein [Methylophilus sp.]HQQ33728.1 hypothetical protein [Methylophilus sp.]